MVPEDESLGHSRFSDPAVRERVRELPPSTTLVALVLADEGPLSIGELTEESLLARRTVRAALAQLEAANLLESRPGQSAGATPVYELSLTGER